MIYNALINKIKKEPTSIKKWSHYDIQQDEWQEIFERPYKLTQNKKILDRNYKIINRIIACNAWLYKTKRINSELCIKTHISKENR